MKRLLLIATLSTTLLFYSCTSSLNTYAEYDKNTDLNKYKTYSWVAPGDGNTDNPQNQQMELTYSKLVLYASNDCLKKKGMVLDNENPDAIFKFGMGIDAKMAYKQAPTVSVGVAVAAPGYGYGYYGGPGYYGGVSVPVSGGQITEHRADEAFIYVQMFDTKTQALLWTSGARKTIDNAADSQKNLTLALQSIFSSLKIKHKGK
ncbi:MAG: DUF4136 domain-containing protein [Bacteroidota bacterium]